MMELFRSAAIIWKGQQNLGRVAIAIPPAGWFMTGFLVLLVIAGFTFLAFARYAHKETVYGFVDTALAVKRVVSQRAGIITSLPAIEGRHVEAGQIVAIVQSGTDLDPQIAELDDQIARSDDRLKGLDHQWQQREQDIRRSLHTTRRSITRAHKVLSLQESKVEQLKRTVHSSRPLFESGYLSRFEWINLQARLVDARLQVEQHGAELDRLQKELDDATATLRQLPIEHRNHRFELENNRSQLRQARLSLLREKKTLVAAPVAGEIRTVLRQVGDFVEPARPILVIVPQRVELTATLLIPDVALGSVETGRPIDLFYDAYPSEEFGTFPARITHLSNHPVMPGDADLPLPLTRPCYLARVDITKVDVYGERIDLQPGMTLRAEIILASQSLLEWLVESLTPDRYLHE